MNKQNPKIKFGNTPEETLAWLEERRISSIRFTDADVFINKAGEDIEVAVVYKDAEGLLRAYSFLFGIDEMTGQMIVNVDAG